MRGHEVDCIWCRVDGTLYEDGEIFALMSFVVRGWQWMGYGEWDGIQRMWWRWYDAMMLKRMWKFCSVLRQGSFQKQAKSYLQPLSLVNGWWNVFRWQFGGVISACACCWVFRLQCDRVKCCWQTCSEKQRFQTLLQYFINYEEFHIDFMVTFYAWHWVSYLSVCLISRVLVGVVVLFCGIHLWISAPSHLLLS